MSTYRADEWKNLTMKVNTAEIRTSANKLCVIALGYCKSSSIQEVVFIVQEYSRYKVNTASYHTDISRINEYSSVSDPCFTCCSIEGNYVTAVHSAYAFVPPIF